MAAKRRAPKRPGKPARGWPSREAHIEAIKERINVMDRLIKRPQGLPAEERRMYLEAIKKLKNKLKELEG